jgi:hypothetical protein
MNTLKNTHTKQHTLKTVAAISVYVGLTNILK